MVAEDDISSYPRVTYWDIVNPHTAQSSSIVAEVILYSRICHLCRYESKRIVTNSRKVRTSFHKI